MLTRFLLPTVLLASTALAPAEEENPLGSKEPFRIRMAEEQVRNPYLRVSLIKCSGNVARWTTALATWPGTCVPIPTGCSAGPWVITARTRSLIPMNRGWRYWKNDLGIAGPLSIS